MTFPRFTCIPRRPVQSFPLLLLTPKENVIGTTAECGEVQQYGGGIVARGIPPDQSLDGVLAVGYRCKPIWLYEY